MGQGKSEMDDGSDIGRGRALKEVVIGTLEVVTICLEEEKGGGV